MNTLTLNKLIEALALSEDEDAVSFLSVLEQDLKVKATKIINKLAEDGKFKSIQVLVSILAEDDKVTDEIVKTEAEENKQTALKIPPDPKLTPDISRLLVLELYSLGERHKKKDLNYLFYNLGKEWGFIGEAEEEKRVVIAKDGSKYFGKQEWLEKLDSAVSYLVNHQYLEYVFELNKEKNKQIKITIAGKNFLKILRQKIEINVKQKKNLVVEILEEIMP